LPCPGGGPSRCQMPPLSVVCLEHPRRLAGTCSGVGLRQCLPSCHRTRPTPLLTIAFTKWACQWFDSFSSCQLQFARKQVLSHITTLSPYCSVFSTSSKCTLMLTWCPLWVSHSDGGGAHTSIVLSPPSACSVPHVDRKFHELDCGSSDVFARFLNHCL
jgi:hypothetical protein